MIISGGSRSNGAFFARHLMRADRNERVHVVELRGLTAHTVRGAFRELEAIASGTRCANYFYHAHLNPREGEQLTAGQWEEATDMLERELGLTGQPRIIVEHVKEGRTHRHVVFSRIDADSMRALPDSLTYRKHEAAARQIEQAFDMAPVASVLVKDRSTPRPPRRPKDWENFRGQESKRDPRAIQAEVTALWHAAETGPAFVAALAAHGYILSHGDKRNLVLVDRAGDDHSLARRIAGVKAAEIRSRLTAIDRESLPNVAQARAMARQGDAGGTAVPPATPAIAAAQVRAMAAQYPIRPINLRGRRSPPPQLVRSPRFHPAPNAAVAAEQVRAVAYVFAASIEQLGHIPQIVADLVDDGRHWWERTTQHVTELVEDVRHTVQGWADALRHGMAVRIHGGRLDLE